MKQKRIASIGECMIEIAERTSGQCSMGFSGDTYNFSVYFKRLSPQVMVNYVTALGNDPYSVKMLQVFASENINTALIATIPNKLPALYLIHTDARGERAFYYYRKDSAAREMIKAPAFRAIAEQLMQMDLIYFSGITLAILDETSRTILFDVLKRARAKGAKIAFDPNYRPVLWPSVELAQQVALLAAKHSDYVFPSYDDEQALFGSCSHQACLDRYQQCDVQEVVLKDGASGCYLYCDQQTMTVAIEPATKVVDTTSAGDSFNGAYLAARLAGQSAEQATHSAATVAKAVIGEHGAIIPLSAMPSFEWEQS